MEKISVVGVGRLGLTYALLLEKNGYDVLAIDNNSYYISSLREKRFHSFEPKINDMVKDCSNINFHTDLNLVKYHAETILLFVPTPNGGGEDFYDHTILANMLETLNFMKLENKHIVICSTIIPTWSKIVGEDLLNECTNCTLSYAPEFIAQGNIVDDFENASHILIGADKEVHDRLEKISKSMNKNPNVKVSKVSQTEAEIIKLAINGFLCMKISYANMIGDYCKSVGVSPEIVLNGVGSDERINNKYLKWGNSYGGECLPRDALALSLAIKKKGINPLMSIASHEYNKLHSNMMSQDLLKQLHSKKQDKFTMKNVNYKPDTKVAIITESPRLTMADNCASAGVDITIEDYPHIIAQVKKRYGAKFSYKEIPIL
jgi:UDPglucose 6-dehydrogenase